MENKLNVGMKILGGAPIFFLLVLSIFPVFAQTQIAVKEQTGAWLKIYPQHVQGIYVDAADYRHGVPIRLESVVVALSDEPKWPTLVPKTSLVNFVSGKAEGKQGCMFMLDRNGVDTRPPWDAVPDFIEDGIERDVCGHFRLRVAKRLIQRAKACGRRDTYEYAGSTLRTGPAGGHVLFVSRDLKQVRCLASVDPQWADPEDPSGMAVRHTVSIGAWGATRSYLHLDDNQSVRCYGYGQPVVYWRKLLPEAEAARRTQFDLGPPVWQKQYLIKTSGFKSSCWGGRRVIDEPISAFSSLYLDDGTLLLKGETSVLRIRASDGSTEAPGDVVKIFDPANVQGVLKEHYEGTECEADALVGFNCTLAMDAGYRYSGSNDAKTWRDYLQHVVQGVDAVMQQIFNDAK